MLTYEREEIDNPQVIKAQRMCQQKWAQTPYDCGIFLARTESLVDICGPGKARAPPAYLTADNTSSQSQANATDPLLRDLRTAFGQQISPLYMNLENSRRFRALPMYANLVSLGRAGFQELVGRNIAFARAMEQWLRNSPNWDVLTPTSQDFKLMNIVLFAPSATCKDPLLGGDGGAAEAVRRINQGRRIYVSGTSWNGRGALRMAVSNVSATGLWCVGYRVLC